MDDRELAVLEQALESRHARLNSELIVEPAKFFRLQAQLGPRAIVGVVRIGNDGVQAVVGAGQLDHDKDARSNAERRGGVGVIHRACAKAGDAAADADQPGAQHISPSDFTEPHSLRHRAPLRSGQLILRRAHDEMSRQAQGLLEIGFCAFKISRAEFGFEEGDGGATGFRIERRR